MKVNIEVSTGLFSTLTGVVVILAILKVLGVYMSWIAVFSPYWIAALIFVAFWMSSLFLLTLVVFGLIPFLVYEYYKK